MPVISYLVVKRVRREDKSLSKNLKINYMFECPPDVSWAGTHILLNRVGRAVV